MLRLWFLPILNYVFNKIDQPKSCKKNLPTVSISDNLWHISLHLSRPLSLPSGEWYCSFCRDLVSPEMVYNCSSQEHSDADGFSSVDRRVCFSQLRSVLFSVSRNPSRSKKIAMIVSPANMIYFLNHSDARDCSCACFAMTSAPTSNSLLLHR